MPSERRSYFWWLIALSTQPKHAFEPEKAAGSPAGLLGCVQKGFGDTGLALVVQTDQKSVVPAPMKFVLDIDKIYEPLLLKEDRAQRLL